MSQCLLGGAGAGPLRPRLGATPALRNHDETPPNPICSVQFFWLRFSKLRACHELTTRRVRV